MNAVVQRFFTASGVLVGMVAVAGVFLMAWPHYVVLVGAAGLCHALAAAQSPDPIRPRHLAGESALVALAVVCVFTYVLRLVPNVDGLWPHLRRMLAAELTSRDGIASLLAYVTAWGLLIGALSLALAILPAIRRRLIASRWQLAALALAAANVIFRYALYDPVLEVGVWRPQGNEVRVAAMALVALLEPLVLYVVVLTIAVAAVRRIRKVAENAAPGAGAPSVPG